jgi:heparin/heparan-sulfate lyase
MMIARTKWDIDATGYSSGAMVVLMNMKEYNAQNHTHLDGGHFSIYYKGHLALDAGIYQGSDASNGWGKENYNNYYSRTIAHNCLLIFDPDEPTPVVGWDSKSTARDGGQFFFNKNAWDNAAQMFSAGKSSQVLAYDMATGVSPEYSYLKGDLTAAYNVPSFNGIYSPKADTVRRSFVFLNHNDQTIPGSLIILDKVVSTNPAFKKTWLLHTQNQPLTDGNRIIATTSTNGRNGKLINTVLIPETGNQSIQAVGGPGKEYWVDKKNYGTVTQEDAGKWRTELSPLSRTKSDNFLNVVQAMDINTATNPADIKKFYSQDLTYVGTMVRDWLVVQQLLLGTNGQPVRFTAGNPETSYKVLITDLKAGVWNINHPDGTLQKTVTNNAGTLSFTSHGGTFQISIIP